MFARSTNRRTVLSGAVVAAAAALSLPGRAQAAALKGSGSQHVVLLGELDPR